MSSSEFYKHFVDRGGHLSLAQETDAEKKVRRVLDAIKKKGYDGIHVYPDAFSHWLQAPSGEYEADVWFAFKPTQIKSVFNRGTFDPHDPDIAKAAKGGPGSGSWDGPGQPRFNWSSTKPVTTPTMTRTFKQRPRAIVEREVKRLKEKLGAQFDLKDIENGTVQRHIKELSFFTDEGLEALKNANVKFYLGKATLPGLNNNQHLSGVRPRGWPPGYTWDDASGGYSTNKNEVCLGNTVINGCSSLAGHETGHAIMEKILSPAEKDVLFALHEKHMQQDPARFGSYFRQGGWAGTEEMFAEALAYMLRDGTNELHPAKCATNFSKEVVDDLNATFKTLNIGRLIRNGKRK